MEWKQTISFIVGIITGMILFRIYWRKPYHILHGPNSSMMRSKVLQNVDGSCYQFEPIVCICPLFDQTVSVSGRLDSDIKIGQSE